MTCNYYEEKKGQLRPEDVTQETKTEELASLLKSGPPGPWPNGWHGWKVTRDAHLQIMDEFIQNIPPYPEDKFSGRGVVSCVSAKPGWSSGKELAQGYLPAFWCMAHELRRHGCDLPIYAGHLGKLEWDRNLEKLTGHFARVVDLYKLLSSQPMRILAGWESKIYSILMSPFEEVLFLDADNLPLKDPTFLFDSEQFRHYGALFWPDVPPHDRPEWLPEACWANVGLSPRPDVKAAESGQLLISKRKCWRELCLAFWINEHSDWFYRFVFGDKDTFILAWHVIAEREKKQPAYVMPPAPGGNHASLIHRGFDGHNLFQHLTRNKPTLSGFPCPDAVVHKTACEKHLELLRSQWHGKLWANLNPGPEERELIQQTAGLWRYQRKGVGPNKNEQDERSMRLLVDDNRIGQGMAGRETDWSVWITEDGPLLTISGIDGKVTAILRQTGPELWEGRWLEYEQCEVVLVK